jgi:membrane protease YdiL (CAAX protease family)
LALAFEDGDNPASEEPKQILTRVDARLRSLVKSHYRKRYVLANLAAFIAIEFVLICFAAALEVRQLNAGHLPILHHYAIYAAFGALGAFLSVITGIRSIDLDINLKTWEYAFAGATRISIGMIGALVVALALDSKFIDPTFGSPPQSLQPGAGNLQRHIAIYLLLTFVGGFSESLVPNLLRRAEQATAGGDTPKPSDEPIVKDIKP